MLTVVIENFVLNVWSFSIIAEQINVVWAWETIISDIIFASSNCGKLGWRIANSLRASSLAKQKFAEDLKCYDSTLT